MIATKAHVIIKIQKAMVFIERFPPQFKPNLHVHKNRETFVILKGKGQAHIDGTVQGLSPGMVLTIKPGCVHGLETKEGMWVLGSLDGNFEEEIIDLVEMFERQPLCALKCHLSRCCL